MREIKFRGINKGGNWCFGDLIQSNNDHDVWIHATKINHTYKVAPATLGQFTGLFDSNGQEIYEGDIVKCGTGRICEVVYFLSPVHAGYDLNPVGGFDCKPPSEFSLWSDLTVIGNVYDNPDLLEQRP